MPLIAADLRRKHERMAEDPFAFLRATFYVWIERWPAVCSELVDAPSVLGVGDLHDVPETVHETLMCLLKTHEDKSRLSREVADRLLGKVA